MSEPEYLNCPKCGIPVAASAVFCGECGASIPEGRATSVKAGSSSADEDVTQIMGPTVVVPAGAAAPPPPPPGNTGTAAPGKRKGGAGRIILIAVIAILALLVIAGALGYFFYLKPRMDVKAFTEDLAPLAERDRQLIDETEKYRVAAVFDTDADPEDILKEVRESREKLEASRGEYEDVLDQINALEASGDTDALKQDFVELNQFYIEEIDRQTAELDYFEQLMNSVDRIMKSTDKLTGGPEPSSMAEVAALTNTYNNELKAVIEELKKLEAPEGMKEFHDNFTAALTEMASEFDEMILAINTNDRARFEAAKKGIKELEKKYDKLGDDVPQEFEDLEKEVEDEEETLIADARGQISAIKTKYGDRWVSGSLNFDIDEGWLKDSE